VGDFTKRRRTGVSYRTPIKSRRSLLFRDRGQRGEAAGAVNIWSLPNKAMCEVTLVADVVIPISTKVTYYLTRTRDLFVEIITYQDLPR
jgi:hypothetical protein